jgi:hypothetical protein
MNVPMTIVGIILAVIAWFNPFALDMLIRVAIFIIGFDMMGIWPKVIIFLIGFFFPFFGESFGMFSWALVFILLAELLVIVLGAGKPYRLFIKPSAVFLTAFFSLGLQPALVVVGIDLLINLTHKIRFSKRKRRKKK